MHLMHVQRGLSPYKMKKLKVSFSRPCDKEKHNFLGILIKFSSGSGFLPRKLLTETSIFFSKMDIWFVGLLFILLYTAYRC